MFASWSSIIAVGLVLSLFLLSGPKKMPLNKMPFKFVAKSLFSFWMVFSLAQLLFHFRSIDQPIINVFYAAFMIGLIALGAFSYVKIAKPVQIDPVNRFISLSGYGLIAVFGGLFLVFASEPTAWVFGGYSSMVLIVLMSAVTAGYLFFKERNFVPTPEPDYPDIPLMTQFQDRVFSQKD